MYFIFHNLEKTYSIDTLKGIGGQLLAKICFFGLVCCFTYQSKAMVMSGRSVHQTTFFLSKLEQAVNQYFVYILSFVTDNNPS